MLEHLTNRDRAIYGTALALILSAFAAVLVLAIHPLSASASPASRKAQTCMAAVAYQAHPSAGTLATLVTDSTHLGRGYLKADVGELYADASSPSAKAAKYAAKDAQYVAEDCA